MKSDKITTVIMIIIIIAIIGTLGFLAYTLITEANNTTQANNNGIENIELKNQISDIQEPTNNQQTTNNVEPILNISPSNNDGQEHDGLNATYYYSQLNETAKQIYDGLKSNKSNLITGNYVIDYGTKFNTLLNSDGGTEKLNQAFQSAWDAFSYDNVDLFYIDVSKMTLTNKTYSLGGINTYKISIGPGDNVSYFQNNFHSKEEVQSAQAYMENIRKQVTEQIAKDDTYTKIGRIHNWLIENLTYEDSGNYKEQHTIYGALKNRKVVCEGYAKTFKYLLDASNVPCVLVSGTGTNSQGQNESHAWNYVQIEDKWYAVDVTWDDPVVMGGGEQTDEMKLRYFLKGSEEFHKDHKEEGKLSENGMTFKFPTLSAENFSK